MTGGGNFPSRKITPDYLVNLLYTTEKMMGIVLGLYLWCVGLNEDESIVSYDVVQSRGCGRGVSAKNSVAFSPIAENAVGSYALGGLNWCMYLFNPKVSEWRPCFPMENW